MLEHWKYELILYFTDRTYHEKDNYLPMTLYSHMSYAIHHSGREKYASRSKAAVDK